MAPDPSTTPLRVAVPLPEASSGRVYCAAAMALICRP